MNIISYMNMIFDAMLGFTVPQLTQIADYFTNCTNWSQLFNPPMFVGTLLYICGGIGLMQLCIIYPFRLLKKLIKYPSRKGCEK